MYTKATVGAYTFLTQSGGPKMTMYTRAMPANLPANRNACIKVLYAGKPTEYVLSHFKINPQKIAMAATADTHDGLNLTPNTLYITVQSADFIVVWSAQPWMDALIESDDIVRNKETIIPKLHEFMHDEIYMHELAASFTEYDAYLDDCILLDHIAFALMNSQDTLRDLGTIFDLYRLYLVVKLNGHYCTGGLDGHLQFD